jgi:hypothetical protein
MKRSILSAMALGVALMAVPLCALAESNTAVVQVGTGAVCGHISVDPMRVVALSYEGLPANIIVARSMTEVVSTTVQPDGNFCFAHLQPDLHTISAFGDDSPGEYNALITPIVGQTRFIEVTHSSDL